MANECFTLVHTNLLEVGRLGERLGADGAGVRSQPRVHLAVSAQAAGVFERLAALFAHVGPLACVLPQVVLVVGAPLESQRTVGTLEGPDTRVHLEKVMQNNMSFIINICNLRILDFAL